MADQQVTSEEVSTATAVREKAEFEITVPLARHQAKLRECARLYAELQATSDRLVAAERQIEGQTQRYKTACAEVARLQEVLHVVTEELRHTQSRTQDLSRENRQLRLELRAGLQEEESEAMLTGRSGCDALEQKVACAIMPGLGPLAPMATTTTITDTIQISNSIQNTLVPSPHEGCSVEERVAINATQQALLVEYTVASFQMDCVPHVQMLQSLYRNDQRISLVRPAINFAQLAVLERQLRVSYEEQTEEEKEDTMTNGSVKLNTDTSTLTTLQRWCATAVQRLALRLAEPQGGTVTLLCRLLPCFTSLRELEVYGLHSTRSLTQLAETLCSPSMTCTTTTLSLPELAVGDEAVVRLWKLLEQRTQLANKHSDITEAEKSASNTNEEVEEDNKQDVNDDSDEALTLRAVPLSMPTLDFTHCLVTDSLTLKTIFCPGLQTLLLPNCEAVTDATLHILLSRCPQLHTLDVSGCPHLSNACVAFINKHAALRVLRLERCPQLTRLELTHVQVLYSSLTTVTLLRAPALRRLPLPITNRCALLQLHAPALEEMVLHDLVIDRHTLHPALLWSSEEWRQLARRAREKEQQQQQNEEEMQQADDVPSTYTTTTSMVDDVVDEEVMRKRTAVLGPHSTPPRLRVVLFSHCTFTDTDELGDFLRQQRHLTRLSLHGCRGIHDAHLSLLPKTLRDLDCGCVASLSDAALRALITRTPCLERLTLKQAGSLSDAGLPALRGLTALRELNLLQLPAVSATAVSVVASALPCLTQLYHESATVLPTTVKGEAKEMQTTSSSSRRLRVLRSDEEDVWLREMQCFPRDLLWLQSCAALSYWREGTSLPPPAALFVARTQEGRRGPDAVAITNAATQASLALRAIAHPIGEEEDNDNDNGEDEERVASALRSYYAMQARCSGTPLRYAQGSKAAMAGLVSEATEGTHAILTDKGNGEQMNDVGHAHEEEEDEEEVDMRSAAPSPSPSSSVSSLPSPTQTAALVRAEQHLDSAHSRDGVARLIAEEPIMTAEPPGPWGAADEMREQLRQPSAHDKSQANETIGVGNGESETEPMAELLNNAALQ